MIDNHIETSLRELLSEMNILIADMSPTFAEDAVVAVSDVVLWEM